MNTTVKLASLGTLRDVYGADEEGTVFAVSDAVPPASGAILAFDDTGAPSWRRAVPYDEDERLRRVIDESVLGKGARPSLGGLPALVSERQAARVLGVSRVRTLAPAIKAGAVVTVPAGKRRLIPKAEVERLAAEGIPDAKSPPPKVRKRARGSRGEVAKRIAEIDLDTL